MSHTQDINNKVQNIKNAAMRVYGSQGLEATHGSLNPHDDMLKHLATADEYEPVVRYLAMCLRTGGDLARRVVEQMIADAEQSLAQQVEHGIIVESADPKARARYVTLSQVGALVMEFAMAEPGTTSMEIWQNHVATTMLPALERHGAVAGPRSYGRHRARRTFRSGWRSALRIEMRLGRALVPR